VYFSTLSLVHRDPPTTVQDQAPGVNAAERDARWRLYVHLRMCETGEQDFEVEEKRTLEMMREVLARYAGYAHGIRGRRVVGEGERRK